LKLNGAIVFVFLSIVFSMLVDYFLIKKNYLNPLGISLKDFIKANFSFFYLKELFIFASFGLITGIMIIFSDLFCRSIVVRNLGVEKIGIYSPIITWGGVFTGFILPSMSTYLYPRFCELKNNTEITGLLNDVIRLITYLMLPLLFIGIPLRKIIIPLFYSNAFLESAKYLPFHFLGILVYVWWYALGLVFTPIGKIKLHGFYMIMFALIDMSVVYFLVPKIALYGWMLKFVVSPIISLVIYFLYLRKFIGFNLTRNNFQIISFVVFALFALFSILYITNDNIILETAFGVFICFISLFFLKKNEKAFILNKIFKNDNFFRKKS
jgi:O-antigen/teichoic acid export membrane protein